jgi:hypothetical protein
MLAFQFQSQRTDFQGAQKIWAVYSCSRCAALVVARAAGWNQEVLELYPSGSLGLSDDIPEKAREYLRQALESTVAPAGAIMLAASAVDAMLKAKDLRNGGLSKRINDAASKNLITLEMAQWAHDVRLDANDQRHADEDAPLPTLDDAKRTVEFALALAQFIFVLPARVERGIRSAKPGDHTAAP